jgi:hypothetical protein
MKTLTITEEAYDKLLGLKNHIQFATQDEEMSAEVHALLAKPPYLKPSGALDMDNVMGLAYSGRMDFNPDKSMSQHIIQIVEAIRWSSTTGNPIVIT